MNKSFAIFLLIVFSSALIAQTDVRDVYIKNAGFDEECNYKVDDVASNHTTDMPGATVLSVKDWVSGYVGWSAAASFEYGYKGQLNSSNVPSLAPDGVTSGSGQGCLGFSCGWGDSVFYTQGVSLPAGTYTLKANIFNTGSSSNGVSLLGWFPNDGHDLLSSLSSFPSSVWTDDEMTFVLKEATEGKIRVGMRSVAGKGSGDNGRLFFDDLQLFYSESVLGSDAGLSSLGLSVGKLTPAFQTNITDYHVYLKPGQDAVEVVPVLRDKNASIEGETSVNLVNGYAKASFKVTAENGTTTKTYTLHFCRNYITDWDGNGATGAGSEPNKFNWSCTPVTDGWSQANEFGIRFQDNVSFDYNGTSQTGRILYIRWDNVGGTNTGSVYNYAMELEACKTYQLSAKIAWHSNGSAPTYTFSVNGEKDNSGSQLAEEELLLPSMKVLKDVKLVFNTKEAGTYFLNIGAPSAVLGAIADLNLIDYNGEAFIKTSVDELRYDSIRLSQSFAVSAYGLEEDISFIAPDGLSFIPASIKDI